MATAAVRRAPQGAQRGKAQPATTKAKAAPAPARQQAAPAKRQKQSVQQVVQIVVPLADKLLLTVEEFAALVGISRTNAWNRVYAGEVRTVMIGRLRRVPRAAAEAFVSGLLAD